MRNPEAAASTMRRAVAIVTFLRLPASQVVAACLTTGARFSANAPFNRILPHFVRKITEKSSSERLYGYTSEDEREREIPGDGGGERRSKPFAAAGRKRMTIDLMDICPVRRLIAAKVCADGCPVDRSRPQCMTDCDACSAVTQ